MRLLHALALTALATLPGFACAPGNAASQLAAPPKFEPQGQAKCGVEKSQARPLIVEWPSPDRLELESKAQDGLVVVKYSGCDMDVLSRCSVPAKYKYRGANIATDRVVIKSDDELYANLPVGAARLEGNLERSGSLTVDMNLVGQFAAEKTAVTPEELQGDCEGATHFVYGFSVGAFDFYAGSDADVGANAGMMGVGVKGHSGAKKESLTRNGDVAQCAKASAGDAQPPANCGAVIRIEVVPLGKAKAYAPTCPSGTKWDGTQCVGTKVVTNVNCPAGSTWNGTQCAGNAPAPGPAGVPGIVAAVVQPAPALPAAAGSCPSGMASIPGGTFKMGDRGENVSVRPFCLDSTEVTVDAYAACANGGQCSAEGLKSQFWDNKDHGPGACNYGVAGRGNHPINCVDWGQSATYCHTQGKRLPTEEEWEWAARGEGEGRTYPWGNGTPDFQACWSGVSKKSGTCPVGSFRDGDAPGGVHDLAGNVWEWTSSNYDATARVSRGGSWYDKGASFLRATDRGGDAPTVRYGILGFRCAR